MRLFFRTDLPSAEVLAVADEFFAGLGSSTTTTALRGRTYTGPLGMARVVVRAEGGHNTIVDVFTDQIGESRLDKNVKKFFVTLHRRSEPSHALEAGY
jgi:hypothetical protein